MATIPLKPVDRVEILSVIDNSIDVLVGGTPVARRARRERDARQFPAAFTPNSVGTTMEIGA